MAYWPPLGSVAINSVGGVANVWQSADATLTRSANGTAYSQFQAIGSPSLGSMNFVFCEFIFYLLILKGKINVYRRRQRGARRG